jgi:hypothetical protein
MLALGSTICYLMQIHDGVFNVFFRGGRLFQLWIVDMYTKIESMQLDWYSHPAHQKVIQADLIRLVRIVYYTCLMH